MEWLLWMIAVAVLGLAAVAASGRLGEMPPTVVDSLQPRLPAGVLGPEQLQQVRFSVVTRGYDTRQVDDLLDRLSRQLASTQAGSIGSFAPPTGAEAEPPESGVGPATSDPEDQPLVRPTAVSEPAPPAPAPLLTEARDASGGDFSATSRD